MQMRTQRGTIFERKRYMLAKAVRGSFEHAWSVYHPAAAPIRAAALLQSAG